MTTFFFSASNDSNPRSSAAHGSVNPALDGRSLHIELCRQWGLANLGREMTADEIIEDWNARSPEDKW